MYENVKENIYFFIFFIIYFNIEYLITLKKLKRIIELNIFYFKLLKKFLIDNIFDEIK